MSTGTGKIREKTVSVMQFIVDKISPQDLTCAKTSTVFDV